MHCVPLGHMITYTIVATERAAVQMFDLTRFFLLLQAQKIVIYLTAIAICNTEWMTMAESTGNATPSAKPTAASGRLQDQYTAQQVIEMFRALDNLPVTDDAATIESEVQKHSTQWLHER